MLSDISCYIHGNTIKWSHCRWMQPHPICKLVQTYILLYTWLFSEHVDFKEKSWLGTYKSCSTNDVTSWPWPLWWPVSHFPPWKALIKYTLCIGYSHLARMTNESWYQRTAHRMASGCLGYLQNDLDFTLVSPPPLQAILFLDAQVTCNVVHTKSILVIFAV